MTDLAGKSALVTGGSSGIGAAVSAGLTRAGAAVTICARDRGKLSRTASDLSNCTYVQADVTNEQAVRKIFAQHGPFDIVVASAGAAETAPIDKTDTGVWTRMIETNLTSAYLLAREAIRYGKTRAWGRVVFIASTAGLKGYRYVSAYCAAKHGVIGLARSLSLETAKLGITVNAVCPGYTETPMLQNSIDNIVKKTGMDESLARETLFANNPMGRAVRPEEVADSVLWLCGEGASSVTGQSIVVAGGEV